MPQPDTSAEFLQRLAVLPQGDDRFTGTCHPAWPGRAFGGQVAAQALQAAAATAGDPAMEPWSVHVYFHAPVASGAPASYDVLRVKDGRTLCSRQVQVTQDDRLRVTATALMGMPGEGPTHQWDVPHVPPPDALDAEERLVPTSVLPEDADFLAMGYPAESHVDLRVIRDEVSDDGTYRPAWMRVTTPLPDDPVTSATTLCYLSDIVLGTTALEPHGGREGSGGLQLGAIELALWFTRPVAPHEWLLFSLGSSFGGHGHAIAHCVVHDAGGDVVAVALQNALMRNA